MYSVEVDFDVYKELIYRRQSESHNENDVLRELLKLPAKGERGRTSGGKPWVAEGVMFPSGTELRAKFKGKLYTRYC